MAIDRIVLSLVIAIGGAAVLPGATFADDNRGTLEQQIACTPDVFRLCGDQIPDANRIVVCLRQNTPQLSAPCRAVFESNNSVSSSNNTVSPSNNVMLSQAPRPRGRMAPAPRPRDEDDQ
jgi:hypothetical protein